MVWLRALLFLAVAVFAVPAFGQRGPVHYFHAADLPPGVVGQGQLLRGGPLPGYFQPVELAVPEGAAISLPVSGTFEPPQKDSVLIGALIGQVYRFKITGLPRNPGYEVFPTIEVINRLYPPPGLENQFPIPVHFTQEELEMALSGRFVTRVIYLEEPNRALPVADGPETQRYFEVRADDDPLRVADRLGRPVAILRMGSRTPDYDEVTQRFLFDCPPLLKLTKPARQPEARQGLEERMPPVPRTESGIGTTGGQP